MIFLCYNESIETSLRNGHIMEGIMYEYKLECYKVNEAESEMNKLAKQGWRVVTVSPNIALGYGIIVTYERVIQ